METGSFPLETSQVLVLYGADIRAAEEVCGKEKERKRGGQSLPRGEGTVGRERWEREAKVTSIDAEPQTLWLWQHISGPSN